MSSAPGNEIVAVAERLFPGASIEPVDGRSWLVSATTGDRRFSVRRIHPAIPAARIDLVHELLAMPAVRGITQLEASERHGTESFDARVWADGTIAGPARPLPEWQTLHLPAAVDSSDLAVIAQTLGDLHRTATTTSLLARAPKHRVETSLVQARRSLALNERALGSEIRKESRARRWLTASRVLLANAEPTLEGAGFLRDEPLVIAHGDLWGSHIVAGPANDITFLDFASLTAAPAAIDLAQLLGRNGAWSGERVEQALNAYADRYPLQPLQRRTLPWLVAIDTIVTCGSLLARAHDDRHPLPESDRRTVLTATDQQLDLLQDLVSAFVPPAPRPYRRPGRRS